MELFPDGHHVRLRSRVHGRYLHADEDAVGVSLRPRRARASLGAAWAVHLVVRRGATYLLLHSAASGRYLALSGQPAPPGHRGRRAVLLEYHQPEQEDIVWIAVRAGLGWDDHVLLLHRSDRLLRANGRYRFWHTGVTVDDIDNRSTMMHWAVEPIPPRPAPPALPLPSPHPAVRIRDGLFSWRWELWVDRRMVRYVRADDLGHFPQDGWRTMEFYGRSVHHLRMDLAQRVGAGDPADITLCVRAAVHGRPTPLVVDLPWSQWPLQVVVLTAGSPGAQGLRHPNVDAA
ncbi:hypothetical protein ACP4OV_006565 [Aristida adscensionis]